MNKKTLKLPDFLKWQEEVFNSKARFKVLSVGRRAGKSYLGVITAFITAFKNGAVFWIAPSHSQAQIGWKLLKDIASQIIASAEEMGIQNFINIKEAEKILEFPSGRGYIQCKTADNPDLLRGSGLDLVVMDECAFIKPSAWEAIRPSLSDKEGKAIFISTPKGKNWFYHLYLKGLNEDFPEWESWQLPTSINPNISLNEIETARNELPEIKFKQEYEADFIDDSFAVFRHFRDCVTGFPMDPIINHQYVMGVDWGKYNDYSVFTVLDVTEEIPELVHVRRLNMQDYQFQIKILKEIYDNYNPYIIQAEKNSIGDVLLEQLQRMNLPVKPFYTSNSSKCIIIESLALAFQKKEIVLYPFQPLMEELEVYETQRTKTGLITYNAPDGFKDDCCISLALAYAAAKRIETLPELPFNFRALIGI